MLNKIYVHHYRCLQNFELDLSDLNSALVIGRNGAGKTSVFDVIELFQQIGRGNALLKGLLSENDFAFGETHKPIVFELTATLDDTTYRYKLEIELPESFSQPRVRHESLKVAGNNVFIRERGQTTLHNTAEFTLDWHHVGLPLISTRSGADPIERFRSWLGNIIVISPIPQLFESPGKQDDTELQRHAQNVLSWIHHHVAKNPSIYRYIEQFLKTRMPDFDVFRFEAIGKTEWNLLLAFKDEKSNRLELNLSQLSDGEKIYCLAAMIIALASNKERNMLCVWDEPDNYISLQELDHFVIAFRKAFETGNAGSQLIVSSHNATTINAFSKHNSFTLSKKSHMAPARLAKIADRDFDSPTIVEAYENGELE